MSEWINENAFRVVRCAQCKKLFYRTPEWGWWYGWRIACSYHCMRAMERADPNSRMNIEARNAAPKANCLARNMRRLQPEEAEGIMADYNAGMTMTQIAERYDRSVSTVSAVIRQGVYKPPAPKATKHKCLDYDGLREIRRMYRRGMSAWEISRTLDLNPTTVYRFFERIREEEQAKRDALMTG